MTSGYDNDLSQICMILGPIYILYLLRRLTTYYPYAAELREEYKLLQFTVTEMDVPIQHR